MNNRFKNDAREKARLPYWLEGRVVDGRQEWKVVDSYANDDADWVLSTHYSEEDAELAAEKLAAQLGGARCMFCQANKGDGVDVVYKLYLTGNKYPCCADSMSCKIKWEKFVDDCVADSSTWNMRFANNVGETRYLYPDDAVAFLKHLSHDEAMAMARDHPVGKPLPDGWGRLRSKDGRPGKIVPYVDSGLGDR